MIQKGKKRCAHMCDCASFTRAPLNPPPPPPHPAAFSNSWIRPFNVFNTNYIYIFPMFIKIVHWNPTLRSKDDLRRSGRHLRPRAASGYHGDLLMCHHLCSPPDRPNWIPHLSRGIQWAHIRWWQTESGMGFLRRTPTTLYPQQGGLSWGPVIWEVPNVACRF